MIANPVNDPMLALTEKLEAALALQLTLPNAEADRLGETTIADLYGALWRQTPATTSIKGAAGALRAMVGFNDMEPSDLAVIGSVLTFLERENVAQKPRPALDEGSEAQPIDGLAIEEAVAVAEALRKIRATLSPLIMQETSKPVVAALERLYDRNRDDLWQVAEAIRCMAPEIVSEVHDRTDFLLSEAIHSGESLDYLAEILAEGQAQAAAIEVQL